MQAVQMHTHFNVAVRFSQIRTVHAFLDFSEKGIRSDFTQVYSETSLIPPELHLLPTDRAVRLHVIAISVISTG